MATYSPIPAIINLDWLAFSVKLIPSPIEKDAHDWYLNDLAPLGFKVVEFSGTNIYRRRVIVFSSEGEKMFTCLFDPFSRVIPYDSCLIEVANKWLYSSNVSLAGVRYSEHNLNWVCDVLMYLHPYAISNMSRIDICADFECNEDQRAIINGLMSNDIYVQRYFEGSSFHTYDANDNYSRTPRCLSWGSKKSNVKWKLYNKSAEVFEWVKEGDKVVKYCNKPYIVEQWKDTWPDCNEDNIWRLEVSIQPMEKFEFHGEQVRYDNIINQFYVDDLFISMYMTRFITRKREGHKDRSNDTRVFLFGIQGIIGKLRQKEPKESREVAEFVSCLRAAMLQRSKVEVATNSQMMALWTNTAVECVRLGHLEGYFNDTYGLPIERIDEVQNVVLTTT